MTWGHIHMTKQKRLHGTFVCIKYEFCLWKWSLWILWSVCVLCRVRLWIDPRWESCHLRTSLIKSQKVFSQLVTNPHSDTQDLISQMLLGWTDKTSFTRCLPPGDSQWDESCSDDGLWLLLQWERLQSNVHLVQGECGHPQVTQGAGYTAETG